jgi:protein N-terminal asparagine amidohydrolase
MAAVAPNDRNVHFIGSDDATTCIIVVVRHSGKIEAFGISILNYHINFSHKGSGAVALAHLDGNGVDEAVTTMVSRVNELALGYPEGRIELQLIGGFRDNQGYAEDLFSSIMRKFCNDSFNLLKNVKTFDTN